MSTRDSSRAPKVAVVVPDFRVAGGAQELAIRLYEVMRHTGRFEPALVSQLCDQPARCAKPARARACDVAASGAGGRGRFAGGGARRRGMRAVALPRVIRFFPPPILPMSRLSFPARSSLIGRASFPTRL